MNRERCRKLTAVASAVMLVSFFTACGETREPSAKSYTVTFVQAGQPDVVRRVKEGATLSDIPAVKPVTGYTVTWEDVDLTDMTENKIVNAVKTPNCYTVTYDANGGAMSASTEGFVYDATYTLPLPVRSDYSFVCWKNGMQSMALTGVWNIAANITLTAAWEAIEERTYTITFIQEGHPDVVKTLGKEERLPEIPAPVSEAGYDIVWNKTDFSDVSGNTTVTAIKTPKIYTIAYDLGELKNDKYVKIVATTQEVFFAAQYTLFKPTCYGYRFKLWLRKEMQQVEDNGTYLTAKNKELIAVWEKDTASDRWKPTPDPDDGWTGFY